MSLQAIFFDMDGTLTVPWIDWSQLRNAIGATAGLGIMDYIDTLPPDRQQEAEAILLKYEMEAARRAPANAGMDRLFQQLDALPLKRALITNNHAAAMHHVVERYGLRFDLCLSREDGTLKPAPDLLMLALDHFSIHAAEAIFVGDGRYDRMASAAAGVRYIHLSHDRSHPEEEETIYALPELLPLINHLDDPTS